VTAIAIAGVPTIQGWAAPAEAVTHTAASSTIQGGRDVKTPEPQHKAWSYKYTAINEIGCWEEGDGCRVDETGYWLASGSERYEQTFHRKGAQQPFMVLTEIRLAGRPGITLYPSTKDYTRHPPRQDNFPSPLDEPENAAKFCARAERQRGVKLIDGKQARGFVLDVKKIDPDRPVTSDFMEMWLDVETNLPILVHTKMMREDFTSDKVAHFQWNIELDPKLFDPTPPEGYKDDTPKPLLLEEQTRRIAEAFRVYAEACGGHYPQRRCIASSTELMELAANLGLQGWPPAAEHLQKGPYAIAREGYREVHYVETCRPDVVYNGKTVGPRDKDKVLLRWKLDDGRYEVIYGDLHSETVTAQRLATLR
jgi:hypothetical protein